jgi:site-specific DNA-methyltransferase (cytosine-N4-specific)
MKKGSDLPFGSEFSPSQIELDELLIIVEQFSGDTKKLEEAILNRFFVSHGSDNQDNRKTLAMNCRLGLKAYGIIDDTSNITHFGKELLSKRNEEEDLYFALAKHILLNLKGMALVQCIKDMQVAGEVVNLTSLRDGLQERGIDFPRGGKHPSIMRLWLHKAGVFIGDRWQIDDDRLQIVLGTSSSDFSSLSQLSLEQKTFLKALANTGMQSPQPANEIVKLAAATYGVKFPEKSLPKLVLHKLIEEGFITATKTTTGRGAKPFMVSPTKKLIAEIVIPLLDQLENQSDPKVIELLKRPIDEILNELNSEDRYESGLALEALAFKLMRLLDMDYVATRLRGQATGGAEVDLIFQSYRLVYSRWQIQCKNTSRVSLDDVAKEVGLTHFLKSNVIVVVTTGEIGAEARRYSNKIMADSNLAIVLIDKVDLDKIKTKPASIIDAFSREAKNAMNLKKLLLPQ